MKIREKKASFIYKEKLAKNFKNPLTRGGETCYNNLPLEKGLFKYAVISVTSSPGSQRVLEEREVLFVFAIIETGGKQYKVNEGEIIFVEKLEAEVDTDVVFDTVKALSKDGALKIGTPNVDGAKVTAKVLRQGKSKKIYVIKYKAKKNEKKKIGHRQPYTKLQIVSIEG